jgi:hypothetical protein
MEALKLGPFLRKTKKKSVVALETPQTLRAEVSSPIPQESSDAPTCFISYSWEAESHTNWIRRLAEALYRNGVRVRWDKWDIKPGTDIPQFIEESIRESSFVLLICTPTFAARANAGQGGVGYEKAIVSAEMLNANSGQASNLAKFVPILRNGDPNEAIPSYLQSRTYVDMRNDELFEMNLEVLLRHIFSAPALTRPPLGKKPEF